MIIEINRQSKKNHNDKLAKVWNTYAHSISPSSNKSVQWIPLRATSLPNKARKDFGLKTLANSGDKGPVSSLNCATTSEVEEIHIKSIVWGTNREKQQNNETRRR